MIDNIRNKIKTEIFKTGSCTRKLPSWAKNQRKTKKFSKKQIDSKPFLRARKTSESDHKNL